MPFRFVLLNRLNLCELFFEKSVREGGVDFSLKMGVNWVFNGLNRCFLSINRILLTQTDPNRPKADPNGPKLFGLIRPPKTRWLVDLLTCWLVGLLACWLCWGGGKKKDPYSHEPGTFEFYE